MSVFTLDGIDLQEMLSQANCNKMKNAFKHDDLTKRLRKTLYYDPFKNPDKDTLSFSVTKSAVACFQNAAPMASKKLEHRYASQVARDACVSPCTLLLGLIYIERLKLKNPSYLEKVSSSDLFLISMMVASKYLYDEGSEDEVFNDEWAVSGDIDVEKINKLEADFLGAIDWHLYVHLNEFSAILHVTEAEIALSNGCMRGWLTYSDLVCLLDCNIIYKQFIQTARILSRTTCMCMIMYSGLLCLAALSSITMLTVNRMAASPFAGMRSHRDRNITTDQIEAGTLQGEDVPEDVDHPFSNSLVQFKVRSAQIPDFYQDDLINSNSLMLLPSLPPSTKKHFENVLHSSAAVGSSYFFINRSDSFPSTVKNSGSQICAFWKAIMCTPDKNFDIESRPVLGSAGPNWEHLCQASR